MRALAALAVLLARGVLVVKPSATLLGAKPAELRAAAATGTAIALKPAAGATRALVASACQLSGAPNGWATTCVYDPELCSTDDRKASAQAFGCRHQHMAPARRCARTDVATLPRRGRWPPG
jgi:hypothetical protein